MTQLSVTAFQNKIRICYALSIEETGSLSLPSIFPRSHTSTQRGLFHTHALETASSVGMPSILSPAQHTAHDRRPPAPPERSHCACSLSHWSQFPACGQFHIAHIVTASSPFLWGGWIFFYFHFFLGGRWVVVEGGCTTCGALITPSGNRHNTFWFIGIFSFSLS